MPSSRFPIILGGLIVLVIAFVWLRGGPSTPAPVAPTPTSTPSPAPPTETTTPSLRRSSGLPSLETAHAGVEPLPELAPPNLEQLRPERDELYQRLSGETNAVLQEVEAALRPFQATDPATVATAWNLANNWGILSKGESTAEQRIEDPVMRKQLADLHRRVLVESAEAELKAFLGGTLPTELQAKLEAIGRQNASSATVRLPGRDPADADRKASRKRAAAGEELPE